MKAIAVRKKFKKVSLKKALMLIVMALLKVRNQILMEKNPLALNLLNRSNPKSQKGSPLIKKEHHRKLRLKYK